MNESINSKLREEVARLKEVMKSLSKPMSDTETAYWAADTAWRNKMWELFAAENPDLHKLAVEAKKLQEDGADLQRKVVRDAHERGAVIPTGFWDQ